MYRHLILFCVFVLFSCFQAYAGKGQDLEKAAWEKAYQGQYSEALELFTQAVKAESRPSAILLAQQYSKGGLIAPQDPVLAAEFVRIADELKSKETEAAKKEEERTGFSTSIKSDQTIENGLKNCCQKAEALQYARNHPWYSEVLELLRKESLFTFVEPASEEEGFLKLVQLALRKSDSLSSQDKSQEATHQNALKLLKVGAQKISSESVCNKILKLLLEEHSNHDITVTKELLEIVLAQTNLIQSEIASTTLAESSSGKLEKKSWKKTLSRVLDYFKPSTPAEIQPQRTQQQTELTRAYHRLLLDAFERWQYRNKSSEKNDQQMLEIAKSYSSIAPLEFSKDFSYMIGYMTSQGVSAFSMKSLALLNPASKEEFEKVSNTILEKYFGELLKTLLKHPEVAESFEGTNLALKHLVQSILKNVVLEDSKSESVTRAFEVFVQDGREYHQEFEDRLIEVMPKVLDRSSYIYDAYISLLSSPIAKLRVVALQSLLTSVETWVTRDITWANHLLEKILKINLHSFNTEPFQAPSQVYDEIGHRFKKIAYHQGIQELWLSLRISHSQFTRLKFANQMLDYFEVKAEMLKKTQNELADLPWTHLLNEVLDYSFQNKTIPIETLYDFVRAAKETGLRKYIVPAFESKLESTLLSTVKFTLRQSIETFDYMILKGSRSNFEDFKNTSMDEISKSVFKYYVENVLVATSSTEDTFDTLAAKRQLIALGKANLELESYSTILKNVKSELFNAFYHRLTPEKDQPEHISVDPHFENVTLSGTGLLYGFTSVRHGNSKAYRMYACDGLTGDAIWAAGPFTNFTNLEQKIPLYAFWKGQIFIANGTNISVLNKNTGVPIDTLSLDDIPSANGKQKILYLDVAPTGVLYVVLNGLIVGINLESRQVEQRLEMPIEKSSYSLSNHLLVGKRLVQSLFNSSIVSFFGISGKEFEIETDISGQEIEHFAFRPHLNSFGDLFYFEKKVGKNQTQYICFDAETRQTLWTYDLSSPIESQPKISTDGSKIFILTEDRNLIALSTDPKLSSRSRLLWKTSIQGRSDGYDEKVSELTVSPDGKSVYGITPEDNLRGLFHFNQQTGAKTMKYRINDGRGRRLIGVSSQGKLYIAPYHY